MKYVDTKVVFREVPDELTLAINISGCPVKCPGCHSSYLAEDIGDELNTEALKQLIESNKGITCVSFMGGDAAPEQIRTFSEWVHKNYPDIKTSWYSGRSLEAGKGNLETLDFIKVGPFIEEYGPLDSDNTNQRFYKITHTPEGPELTDWTYRFK